MSLLDAWKRASSIDTTDTGLGKARNALVQLNALSQSTDPMLLSSPRSYLVIITQGADDGESASPKVVVGQVPAEFQVNQSSRWHNPWGAGIGGDGTLGNLMALSGNRFVTQVQTVKVWQGSGDDLNFSVAFEFRAWSDPIRDVMTPLSVLTSMALPSLGEDGFLRSPGATISSDDFLKLGADFIKAVPKFIGGLTGSLGAISSSVTNPKSGKVETVTKSGIEYLVDGNVEPVMTALTKTAKTTVGKIAHKNSLQQYMRNKISINIGNWFSLDNVVINSVDYTLKSQQMSGGSPVSATVVVTFSPMFAVTVADLETMFKPGQVYD